MFNGVSEIKFPEGKYGHPIFYLHFVSNLCEYAKTTFHFINLTIQDTRDAEIFHCASIFNDKRWNLK